LRIPFFPKPAHATEVREAIVSIVKARRQKMVQ